MIRAACVRGQFYRYKLSWFLTLQTNFSFNFNSFWSPLHWRKLDGQATLPTDLFTSFPPSPRLECLPPFYACAQQASSSCTLAVNRGQTKTELGLDEIEP